MALQKVTRYNCEYCGQDFRTPDRHDCKFDPKYKNCHSCKHCRGFKKEDREGGIDVGIGIMPTDQLYPVCVKEIDNGYGAQDMCINGYYVDCDEYEWCGGRWVDYVNKNKLQQESEWSVWI